MLFRSGRTDLVEAAARARKHVADEMLLPRTDRHVSGGDAWLEKIKQIASSRASSRDYLATAAMLDMVERTPHAG